MERSVIYKYEVEYDKPIETIWERVTDTNRFHEITGFEPYAAEEKIQSDNSIIRFCTGRIEGSKAIWQERFGEWIAPYELKQRRDIRKPFEATVLLETKLLPTPTGCKQLVNLTFSWKSIFSEILYRIGLFKHMNNSRRKVLMEFVKSKDRANPIVSSWKPPTYSKTLLERVKQLVSKINEKEYGHHLAQNLANYVMYSLVVDADQIRPLELAKKWKLPPQNLIEVCLQSVTEGLLDMRWDLLCPQCRVAKARTFGLHELPKGVHCASCNINFDLNFDKNVELIFAPAKWLREIDGSTYCMLSAQTTPHILVQWRLQPGEEKEIELPLIPGDYRCRSLEVKKSLEFEIVTKEDVPTIELTEEGFSFLGKKGKTLKLINRTPLNRYVIIERKFMSGIALTGQKVLAMKVFRDLCPEQLLKPGDDVGISNLTVLFTDLKDSTAFYYQSGEAAAFKIVREHYQFLSLLIYKYRGTIVKTIGDSVMVVFNEPADAIRASLEIQAHLDEFNAQNKTQLKIKMGLHQGSCIAVNLNNIMDYFGTAINITARLHALSNGTDVVISETLMQDPAAKEILETYSLLKESELVKGIPEPITFYRVIPRLEKKVEAA